jgi:hypothetical protein
VYEHKATIGDMSGLSLTVQVGRPDVGGTVNPFDYLGCKVTQWQLSQALDADLELELTLDGQDEDTSQTLAAASYASGDAIFGWEQLAVTIDGAAFDVRSFSLEGAMGLKTDRYFVGGRTKKEPIGNDLIAITGELEGDFEGLTEWNHVRNGDMVALTAIWTGGIAEDAFTYAVEITLPSVRFDAEGPKVDGPDTLKQGLKFKALDDSTADAPISIVYRTTDTSP